MDFEHVWDRIRSLAGEPFYELGGKVFTYTVTDDSLVPSGGEPPIRRRDLERVYAAGEVPPPRTLKNMGFGSREASYIFSILTDRRLRKG